MIKSVIKNVFLVSLVVFVLTSCDLFVIDNYEGPNATIKGSIIDAVTKEMVQTEMNNGSTLKFKELDWAAGGILTRVIMPHGEYQDKLFFAGKYRLEFSECNFYPHVYDEIVVNKGENVRDFEVTPYIRVKNCNIRKDGDRIVATFNLQAGRPEVRLSNIAIYYHTDIYVGQGTTSFPITSTSASTSSQNFSPAAVIDEATTYTLAIDLTHANNKPYFKYLRNHYFRVGAMASIASGGTNVGTIRRNYAPHTAINFSVPQ